MGVSLAIPAKTVASGVWTLGLIHVLNVNAVCGMHPERMISR